MAVHNHGSTIHRAADGVANEGLPRIGVPSLIVRGVIQKNQALAVRSSSFLKDFSVAIDKVAIGVSIHCGNSCGILEREDDVLVQDVKVAVGTVGDGATVEGFGHVDKAPFVCTGHVDAVLPELGWHPLAEISPKTIDAFVGLIGFGASCREAGLFEPVGNVAGKVFPDGAGNGSVGTRAPAEIVIVHGVSLNGDGAAAGGSIGIAGDKRSVATEKDVFHVIPFPKVVPVGSVGHVRRRVGGNSVLGTSTSGGRVEASLTIFDLIRGVPSGSIKAGFRKEGKTLSRNLAVPSGVVEGSIQNNVHSFSVGIGNKSLECGHG